VSPSRPVEQTDELEALTAFERYAGQEVSFTDCVSFVLMRKHGSRKAFSYDRHFALAGFEFWRGAGKPLFKPQRQKGLPPDQ
jgi:predicted nucleic acid-binding protein